MEPLSVCDRHVRAPMEWEVEANKVPNAEDVSALSVGNVIALDECRWESHCRGLYQLPAAA